MLSERHDRSLLSYITSFPTDLNVDTVGFNPGTMEAISAAGGGEPCEAGANNDSGSNASPHLIPTESAAAARRSVVLAAAEAGRCVWFGFAWDSVSKTARSKASLKGALTRS